MTSIPPVILSVCLRMLSAMLSTACTSLSLCSSSNEYHHSKL